MNFETASLALGLIRALRERAADLGDLSRGMPFDLRIEYRGFLRRAMAVTEATTLAEVTALYAAYLEMASRNGITPRAEMN